MKKYIRSFFGLVYMSLGAMMFVIPLQWWYFGEISLLSLPFTLLISPLIECMLLLLWPFLILSLLGWHFLCLPLAWLVSLIGTGIEQLSALFASASPMVSLNYPFFPLILFGCMAVILCMFFDRRYHWLHALILFLLSSALFFIGIGLYRTAHSGEVTVDYINSGKNDVLLIVSDGSAMIADITDGEKTSMVRTLNRMAERCATEVDTFLLTHIHRRHVNSIRAVLSECMVRRLLIPKAADKYEAYIIQDIADLAAQYDTEILYYSREQANKIRFEDAVIEMPAYTELARSEHPLIALLVENGEASAAYACMAAWEHDAVWDFLDGADHLILGVNGPVYKSPPDTFPDGVRTYSTESEALDADIRKLAGAEISRIPALTETGILLKP